MGICKIITYFKTGTMHIKLQKNKETGEIVGDAWDLWFPKYLNCATCEKFGKYIPKREDGQVDYENDVFQCSNPFIIKNYAKDN